MFDEFYGLTGRPFQLTPDPAFYFESGTHRKALSYLGYGMAQGEGFIVITGEVGAGKSTLVAHLMNKIDHDQMTVGQVVTSKLDAEELIHVVAQSFGLDIEGRDKASALGAIESFLHDEAREGRRCLLVVDESQNLEISALEELRMLSNFQLGSHPLLQTLLLGQPEFRETLQTHNGLEQLRQRVIAAHHLAAMESGEIELYVKHRLGCVGWQDSPEFDPAIFNGIYEATGGIPRRVNQVMTRLLLLGAVEQHSRIDGTMLAAVVAEMSADNAFVKSETEDAKPVAVEPVSVDAESVVETSSVEAAVAAQAASPAEPHAQVDIEAMLAERDAQIKELQQALVELSEAQAAQAVPADFFDKLNDFEQRIDEQERSVRQVLTMMIEWAESEGAGSRAAA